MLEVVLGLFSRKQEAPVLSRRESLSAVPMVNGGVTPETGVEGNLILKVEVKRGTGFMARFQPPVMEKVIELDELGSFVFGQIDGKRNVVGIINLFQKKYRVNRREAELSAAQFLRSLAQRQVISLVIK